MAKSLDPAILGAVQKLTDHHPENFVTMDIPVPRTAGDQWEVLIELVAAHSGVLLRYNTEQQAPGSSAVMQAMQGAADSAQTVVRVEGQVHQVHDFMLRVILLIGGDLL